MGSGDRLDDREAQPGAAAAAALGRTAEAFEGAVHELRVEPGPVIDHVQLHSVAGGGLAGHNGLKALKEGLGGPDFHRVRVGVGRPDTTDSEAVAKYVLSRFREPDDQVRGLIEDAAREVERVVDGSAG